MSTARRRKSLKTAPGSKRPSDSLGPAHILYGRVLLVCAALTVSTLIVYSPVWRLGFITLDDPKYVLQNPYVLAGLTWRGVHWAFTTNYDGNWFPLTWLSLMLDAQFHGQNAGGYHLTNLVFHIANAALLFGLLYWITGALGRSAFVAGLFAVHPLHVESVAWVTERKDVLSSCFWLLTMWAYVSYVRRPGRGRYLTVLLLFALGLMSKPMLVTLPFVLLLLDYWPLRRVSVGLDGNGSGSLEMSGSAWRLIKEKLPLLGLTMVSSIVTFIVQKQGGAVSGFEAIPWSLRFENSVVSYTSYIGKMLWPSRLAVLYPFSVSLPEIWVIGSILILIGLSLLAMWAGVRYPYLPVGWLWYLGTLVPVIGFIQVGYQSMADRYTYIPLIGLFIIVAWGAADLLAHWSASRIALPVAAAIVLLACSASARKQLGYWQNSITLWHHALEVTTDNSHAHSNLGMALAQEGKTGEAIAQYEEALRINPEDSEAHNNLGNALFRQGRSADAIAHYSEAVRLRPGLADAHNGFGAALADQNRFDEAVVQYSEALRLNPNDADFHTNLALVYSAMGNSSGAIQEFSEAIRLMPTSANVHYGFGQALIRDGKTEEARQQFETALRIDPQFTDAQKALDSLKAGGAGAP